jgi:heme exporter protein A
MAEIVLDNVGKWFGERKAFSGVSDTLSAGDRLLVRGPNGSGKSTLLKMLAGLLEPSRGKIVRRLGAGARDRRNAIGYLSPDLVLYDELTVRENLGFFATLRGLADRSPDAVLKRVRMEHRADDLYGTLSTGLKQRGKLAFALLADPSVLILDEPGANLDDEGIDLVVSVIGEAAEQGIVVLATNDPREFGYGNKTIDLA